MAARALWCALLLAQACAAQELQRTSVFAILNAPLQPGEVRHRIAVRGDGNRVVAHLELSGAEEVADAAYAFGVAHGVDRGSTRRLAAAVCGGQGLTAGEPAPPCGREAALLYENAVADPRDETGADSLDGLLRIWERGNADLVDSSTYNGLPKKLLIYHGRPAHRRRGGGRIKHRS